MLQNRPPQRRRHNDAHASRNFRKDMARALRDFSSGVCTAHFPVNPVAVFHREGGLRRNLLRKKAIRRRSGNAASRSVRLVKIPAVLQVSHDVADGGGAQGLLETLGNGTRGHRFAPLDLRAHRVRQNLTVTPFLESWIPHSSTHVVVLLTILGGLSSAVKGESAR